MEFPQTVVTEPFHPKLTWDAVLALVEGSPEGLTNQEIADALLADYADVSLLTKIMWKAQVLGRKPRDPRVLKAAYVYVKVPQ